VNNEEELSVALHVVADSADAPPPPVDELIRRGRRARMLARSMVAAGVVVAVVGTTALTVAAVGPRVAREAAPPVDVAAAGGGNRDTSFRISRTWRTTDGRPAFCSGGIDPAAQVGWEKGDAGGRYEIRFVGGVQYVKPGGRPWRAQSRSRLTNSLTCDGPVDEYTVDPAAVVQSLREKGPVEYTGRTGRGDEAVDTYRFSYSIKGGLFTYSGVISAGVTSRHVLRVTQNVSGEGESSDSVTVFDGFGEPVRVVAPKL
jgi:hypothetical protein